MPTIRVLVGDEIRGGVSTYITTLDVGAGLRVAVKDLIDLAGYPTTAGCRAVADSAAPALADAVCIAQIARLALAGQVRIVGKTNLHELAYGTSGINRWFGTPRNPLDARLIPGGSSSGSAVAIAEGSADVALGTDTGGSVRVPAACCGVAGLKTTWGRVPVPGTWPLAPSLDTIGPLARDVAGLVTGMQLLEPGFTASAIDPGEVRVHRLRLDADPVIERAVDAALARAGLRVVDVPDPGWTAAFRAADVVLSAEAWRADRELLRRAPEGVSPQVAQRLRAGATITKAEEQEARAAVPAWRTALGRYLSSTSFIALPVLRAFPPAVEDAEHFRGSGLALPVNFAGLPAVALPVPSRNALPASLQLIGAAGGEEALLAVAGVVEAAAS
jgi:amidase